jgi:G3E family GTPase
MSDTLPVTVVTGFLGAGKTTLVNYWLAEVAQGDIAVIVNEHADVGIDGELLAARARVVVELSGGCICCTTHAELVNALDTIAKSDAPPKRILIETSGAASPAGVLRAIVAGGRSGLLRLDGVITVFDATRVEAVLEHDLALEQLGYADIVVLSRADVCTHETLTCASDRLAAQNGAALFTQAARGELQSPTLRSLASLLAKRNELPFVPRLMPAIQTPHVYESVSLTHEGNVDGERFADFVESELAEVAGRIFRLKGVLAVSDLNVRMIVQGVGDSVEVTFGEPWSATPRTCRLVVVGFGLDRDRLRSGFSACVCS